jgi:ABC-type multidrug transport system fused ATPase/permease subunit
VRLLLPGNLPIPLLDEATSSFGLENGPLIQEALTPLMRRSTSFIIAHRLTTMRDADRLISIAGGRIVEFGTHAGLQTMRDGSTADA